MEFVVKTVQEEIGDAILVKKSSAKKRLSELLLQVIS